MSQTGSPQEELGLLTRQLRAYVEAFNGADWERFLAQVTAH